MGNLGQMMGQETGVPPIKKRYGYVSCEGYCFQAVQFGIEYRKSENLVYNWVSFIG